MMLSLSVHATERQLYFSLWGPHATKFEAESESLIQLGSNAPVVLLFAGVTVKIFNSMSLCLLSANDPYLYA